MKPDGEKRRDQATGSQECCPQKMGAWVVQYDEAKQQRRA
jgi:hypothetical protein